MTRINAQTSLEELAVLVSQALEQSGIRAVLSGGSAVSVYSKNEYQSQDLDFVSSADLKAIAAAIAPLGFYRVKKSRHFEHDDTQWYVEFPPGPLAFGETYIYDTEALLLETAYGPLRIVTPTQIIMDRIAAYVYWRDNPSFDQALMVAKCQQINWSELYQWAKKEHIGATVIQQLQQGAE